jgi:acetylornithine deacetylase/succinyl-diaminopimelate desuccinylase-like protein
MKAAAFLVALMAAVVSAAPGPEVLRVREWRGAHEGAILTELIQLLSLPNVAANRADIAKNADLLTSMFERRGFKVSRWETKGSPIVFARRDAANARGSVIFYFHYDGQPSDAKEWTRGAPYNPAAFIGEKPVTITAQSAGVDPNTRIYARSASDDKGPIVAFLAAIEGLIAVKADIPWNIRVVLDGEEEAGSRNFNATLLEHMAEVKSDYAVIVDSPRHPSGLPTVYYGARGGSGATIKVHGAIGDLHSGNYGNFVTDPAMALAKLIASMKDANNNVTIKGFYDDVVPLTATERRAIDEIPNIDQKLLEEFGLARQEHPESRIELQHNRPTLSVLGLEAGQVYSGTRSAIPGSASARIEMRLVKGLTPAKQVDLLVAHIREQGFHVVDKEPDMATRRKYPLIAQVTRGGGGGGGGLGIAKTSMDNPVTIKAAEAIRALNQRLVQLPTIGGGLPFGVFSESLALPSIGLAVANFDNNQHAANENIRVGHFWEAIEIFAALATMRP